MFCLWEEGQRCPINPRDHASIEDAKTLHWKGSVIVGSTSCFMTRIRIGTGRIHTKEDILIFS